MMNQFQINVKSFFITLLGFLIFACSSQEYTTAKLAIQQSDWSKAGEWLPKAMKVEPDNPEIPIVYAIEVMRGMKTGRACMTCSKKHLQ